MKKTKKIREPLVDKAYNLIKKKIITLQYEPGKKIEEKALMSDVGVGRTPIREAIKMLISEGLVVSYGTNSVYVKDISLKACRDLMALLTCLGNVIFDLANQNNSFALEIEELEALNRNMEQDVKEGNYLDFITNNGLFHKTLAKISRNEYLVAFINNLYNEEMRLAFTLSENLLSPEEHYERVQAQHTEVVKFFKEGDFENLKNAYQTHMKYGQKRLIDYFSQ
jgi:DNA-binding GntR family transcriptional regulator